MTIKQWPEKSRPREKLLDQGAESLSDSELLAIFLRTGIPGLDAVGLAQSILVKFGSLNSLFSATKTEFCEVPGLGQAKYAQLQAVLEMSRRYLLETVDKKQILTSPDAIRTFLLSKMQNLTQEQFAVIWLDSQHRMIKFETLFKGTIDSAAVYPREVVKSALSHQAAAAILVHNHPSGVAEASTADRIITDRLVDAMQLIDVKVLDHFIVGQGIVVSFAERGWL